MVTAGYTVALSGFNIPVWRNTAVSAQVRTTAWVQWKSLLRKDHSVSFIKTQQVQLRTAGRHSTEHTLPQGTALGA